MMKRPLHGSMELEGVMKIYQTKHQFLNQSLSEYKLEVAEEFDEHEINAYDSPQYAMF